MTPESAEVLRLDGHVEEIPAGFGDALILGSGCAVASGPIESALASGPLSAAFGRPLVVERIDGRFAARGVRPA